MAYLPAPPAFAPSLHRALRRAAPLPFWLAVTMGLALAAAGLATTGGDSVLAPASVVLIPR